MHALPLLLALACAAAIAPAVLRALGAGGHTKANYRGRELPFPLGVLTLAAAVLALIPLELLQRLASARLLHPELLPIALYALGVIALGLVDDVFGAPPPGRPQRRGWRGHGAAAMRGELSTGVLKAAGSLGLALLAMSYRNLSDGRWLLAAAVLVLATNLFNLLDLRPGRSLKAFVVLGAALTLGAWDARPLAALGLFAAPVLIAGAYDVRERAMLGDTGSNLVGALAGLWLVLSLSTLGLAIATGVLVIVTAYGELRSLSALIERAPP